MVKNKINKVLCLNDFNCFHDGYLIVGFLLIVLCFRIKGLFC